MTINEIKSEVFLKIIKIFLFTGLLFMVYLIYDRCHNGNNKILLYLDLLILGLLIAAAFIPGLPDLIRIIVLEGAIFGFGGYEIFLKGFDSMGFFLFSISIMIGAILFNKMLGWISFAISILFSFLLAVLHLKIFTPPETYTLVRYITHKWIFPVFVYTALMFVTLYLLNMIMKSLHKYISEVEHNQKELKSVSEEFKRMAYQDPVTELPNNRKLVLDIDEFVKNHNEEDCCIHQILIELIDIENINIQYGVETGNKIIEIVGARLNQMADYQTYRTIGARFVLRNKFKINREKCESILDDIKSLLKHPITNNNISMVIHYSGAELFYPDDINIPQLLTSNLMMTMQEYRNTNRDDIIHFSSNKMGTLIRQNDIHDGLINAIQNNEIKIVIQPKLNLKTGKIAGGELLSRWTHETMGNISPGEFIPIAEKTHLIIPLTHILMKKSHDFFDVFTDSRIGEENTRISINISPLIIKKRLLSEFSNYSNNLNNNFFYDFELTEGIFLGSENELRKELEILAQNKIRISIDDFGTGYSNLEYLQDINADIIKIDKRFITNIPHDEKQKDLVTAVVEMSKALKLKIVVEGVENEEQLTWLQTLEIDEIQGFYFSKPMNLIDFKEFYNTHNPGIWQNRNNKVPVS